MQRALMVIMMSHIRAKNASFVFSVLFWGYIGQPDNHIGWATSLPFTSIYSIHQRTNPWKFHKKVLRIGWAGKWLFLRPPFFPSSHWKTTLFFIWGIIYFWTIDVFFRILEKTSSELICTWLYIVVNVSLS